MRTVFRQLLEPTSSTSNADNTPDEADTDNAPDEGTKDR